VIKAKNMKIIEPMILPDMVLKMYEFLIMCEVRVRIGLNNEDEEAARQDGYVCCMGELFGTNEDDDKMDEAMEHRKLWPDLVTDFIDENLINTLDNIGDEGLEIEDQFFMLTQLGSEVKLKLKPFLLDNWHRAMESTRYL
jgi:hypothetical protein